MCLCFRIPSFFMSMSLMNVYFSFYLSILGLMFSYSHSVSKNCNFLFLYVFPNTHVVLFSKFSTCFFPSRQLIFICSMRLLIYLSSLALKVAFLFYQLMCLLRNMSDLFYLLIFFVHIFPSSMPFPKT